MGTLFHQEPRRPHYADSGLDGFLANATKLAKKHKISVADVIAAKHALEIERQNNLYVNNGDAFDEQMSGFGELIQELNQHFSEYLSYLTDD